MNPDSFTAHVRDAIDQAMTDSVTFQEEIHRLRFLASSLARILDGYANATRKAVQTANEALERPEP